MQGIAVQNLPHTERWQTSDGSSTINQSKGTFPNVKDRVSNDIGAEEPLQDWADINWKLVKKRVRNLRQRIYRATQNGQWNKVRVKDGGTNGIENLIHLHVACHRHIHTGRKSGKQEA